MNKLALTPFSLPSFFLDARHALLVLTIPSAPPRSTGACRRQPCPKLLRAWSLGRSCCKRKGSRRTCPWAAPPRRHPALPSPASLPPAGKPPGRPSFSPSPSRARLSGGERLPTSVPPDRSVAWPWAMSAMQLGPALGPLSLPFFILFFSPSLHLDNPPGPAQSSHPLRGPGFSRPFLKIELL
jgi:hypothetical protein